MGDRYTNQCIAIAPICRSASRRCHRRQLRYRRSWRNNTGRMELCAKGNRMDTMRLEKSQLHGDLAEQLNVLITEPGKVA